MFRLHQAKRIVTHPVMVAAMVAAVISAGPAVAATVADFARNAEAVDGRSAVKYTTSRSARKRKLVATNSSGRLPNNIISKASDADKLDGIDSNQFVRESDTVGVRVFDIGAGTGEQVIPDGAATAVTWSDESFDTAGAHSTTTNTSRLTAPAAGVYVITGNLHWQGTTGGERRAIVRLNGTTVIAIVRTAQDAANEQFQSVTTIWNMQAGDYVELVAFQDAGLGGTSIATGSASTSNFGMTWTGPADS